MSLPKLDWDQEIRSFLETYFEPISSPIEADDETEKLSLSVITNKITRILPGQYIYEEDVFEALQELGFKIFSYTIPPEIDEETGREIFPEKTAYAYFMNKKTAVL
ncbi:hypothetical protein [Mesonia aestuariivivens]|uniref:Uncharacterized protein n=1 Tax=Mesonia aestuariivivens TaxID=2796128 RepID=A0ABS6W5B8_9FLAO|nr:hypothetical protein [Mesonia aestuariivivens]MBW2962309.1 hypothetical protein [Mesonia aestuariivivens]